MVAAFPVVLELRVYTGNNALSVFKFVSVIAFHTTTSIVAVDFAEVDGWAAFSVVQKLTCWACASSSIPN